MLAKAYDALVDPMVDCCGNASLCDWEGTTASGHKGQVLSRPGPPSDH